MCRSFAVDADYFKVYAFFPAAKLIGLVPIVADFRRLFFVIYYCAAKYAKFIFVIFIRYEYYCCYC